VKTRRLSIVVCLALALACAAPGFSQSKSSVEHIKVHGKSLEGNLEGDSPDRDVFVYLPPSYASNSNQRYPVVYLLHGYGLTGERWMTFANLAELSDKDLAAGTMKEMILVNPDAHTIYDGSMYSASATTGDWETFIAEDLVSYIDSHYRTIPDRMSRGLGGHSMGGYGTVRIGMKRPDVFSSLYIMSACCLLTNPYAQANRGAAPAVQAAPATPATPPAETNGQRGAEGQRGGQGQRGGRGGGRGLANAGSAQAAAWASNPNNPPKYFDLPTKDGAVQPLIAAKFIANSPLIMIDQYVTNLKKYHAIMGDVGTEDTLAASNRQMDEIFTTFGIKHTFETYEGDHTNHVKDRFEQKVLPFFSNNLSFTAAKK
jgi:enterochelin esterase-like enzyme